MQFIKYQNILIFWPQVDSSHEVSVIWDFDIFFVISLDEQTIMLLIIVSSTY